MEAVYKNNLLTESKSGVIDIVMPALGIQRPVSIQNIVSIWVSTCLVPSVSRFATTSCRKNGTVNSTLTHRFSHTTVVRELKCFVFVSSSEGYKMASPRVGRSQRPIFSFGFNSCNPRVGLANSPLNNDQHFRNRVVLQEGAVRAGPNGTHHKPERWPFRMSR